MGRTAAEEHFGCSVDEAISANYQLRLPSGPGGCRFYVLRPSVAALSVVLPVASFCQAGGIPSFVIANRGSHTMTLRDLLGSSLGTIAVGNQETVWLFSGATPWGTWINRAGAISFGTALDYDRVPLDLRLTQTVRNGFNLADHVDSLGYDRSLDYALRVTIAEGVVIGNEAETVSFETGEWTTGTTLVLTLEQDARICGKGGDGGRGARVYVPPGLLDPARDGEDGGNALTVRVNTSLYNHGYIQGGGGGGGGGDYAGSTPGGGGGGGAGYIESEGGAPGATATGQTYGIGAGGAGTIGVAGLGGVTVAGWPGGSGGGPGQAGSGGASPTLSAGAGGAAGSAIRVLTGKTLNKVEAGTINGAEVAF